jgi:hypothetical protein
MKELLAAKLRNIYDEVKLTIMLNQNNNTKIAKCRRFLLCNESDKYAALILHLSDVRAAQELYFAGFLWNAEIFECELYDAIIRIRQCFKCYELGYIAKYCKKRPRCGYCAIVVHEHG